MSDLRGLSLHSQGTVDAALSDETVRSLLSSALDPLPLDGQRVLVLIPDATRSAPIPLLFRLLYDALGQRVAALDYLVALGTHPPMDEAALAKLVGADEAERAARYPKSRLLNHAWDDPAALRTAGTLSLAETRRITDGLLAQEVPVTLNRLVFEYDAVLICGPVFPHEVAGFSGGAKYLFPGIAGADIINFTHWLGALVTSMHTIGVKDTPVRRVIERAAELVPTPIIGLSMAMRGDTLHGLAIGPLREAWSEMADLSARLNIVWVPRPFQRVLSMPAARYDDLWTAAKAMYKTEPAIADGGEVIIYAPHLAEVSYTHGALIDSVGYHVRDYFLKQWDHFRDVPGSILAHSTHVKGMGTYDAATREEHPRITVTLATAIPEDRCRRINLGYQNPDTIDPAAWAGREEEGILVVPHAGEVLFRVETPPGGSERARAGSELAPMTR